MEINISDPNKSYSFIVLVLTQHGEVSATFMIGGWGFESL